MSSFLPVKASTRTDSDADLAVQDAPPDLNEPRKYKVIMHNDDYTTMDFVVEVLRRFFSKSQEEAVKIMMEVHELGRAVCGVFTHEIAETKIAQVHEFARFSGHPLKCSMEPL